MLERKQSTNINDIAITAKSGDKTAIGELWEAVRRLMFKIGSKYIPLYEDRGMDKDDYEQDLFFAMLYAVEAYKPDKGLKFNSYLTFSIKKVCLNQTLRYYNGKFHELQTTSLDQPISEDNGGSLVDFVPDLTAEQPFTSAEDDIDNRLLRALLEESISTLPGRTQEAVNLRFFSGLQSEVEVAEQMGVCRNRVSQLLLKSYRILRQSTALCRYHDDYIDCKAGQHTGLGAWKATGCSVQERILLHLEEKEEEKKEYPWEKEKEEYERRKQEHKRWMEEYEQRQREFLDSLYKEFEQERKEQQNGSHTA